MAATKKKPKTLSRGSFKRIKGLAEKIALVDRATAQVELPIFKAGDTVRIHVRIKEGDKERIQMYEGLVIARGNHAGGKSLTVRKISHGVGVERIFQETSPKIAKMELVQEGKVRRAKLYYVRGLQGRAARIERELDNTPTAAASAKAASGAPAPKKA